MVPNLKIHFILLAVAVVLSSCTSNSDTTNNTPNSTLYFPPTDHSHWETISPETLQWNVTALEALLQFIETKNSKAFIILKDGKIALEWYANDFGANSNHSWNSVAKTLSAFTIGVAQEEGLLDIDTSSQQYLGQNWSNMTNLQEETIKLKHHLSMTTGLDYTVANANCTEASDLIYKQEPGTFWYYHNAPYTLTHAIVEAAVNNSFSSYFNTKIQDRIGMEGFWLAVGCYKLYFSNARSMARFGLLCLNKGAWDNTPIMEDTSYFEEMTNSSQIHNEAYGYFWWLNGKESYRLPGSETLYQGTLIPNAPADLIAGLGKNDQKLYVVPSQNLVIVRMGDATNDSSFGPSGFDNELWEKLNAFMN